MSAGFATTLAKLKYLIAPRRHCTEAEAARFGEAIRSVWQMVRALMSSSPVAVSRIILRRSDRAARPSPCSFSCARGPRGSGLRDPDPLRPAGAAPCLNDDPRRVP